MKTTLIFLSSLLIAVTAFSAVHYVNINGGAPYYEVQPAINASSAGDTILVGSGFGYQGFNVDRRLVIMGVGTGLINGESTRIEGVVILSDAADSTELWSLWIRGNYQSETDSLSVVLDIRSGTKGVLVARCLLENWGVNYYKGCAYLGNQSSANFLQCVFWIPDYISDVNTGIHLRSMSEVEFTNCLFSKIPTGISQSSGFAVNIEMRNCVFSLSVGTPQPFSTNATGNAENCSFLCDVVINTSSGPHISYTYCAFSSNVPTGPGNISCGSADFVNLNLNNYRLSDYHLSDNSVLRNSGNPYQFDLDSTRADIGIYGGMHPFVTNGAPCYPYVLKVDVPTFVPQSGAIRIHVYGRIGSAD